MILVLLLVYIGLLLLAFKFKLVQPTLFWKLSPIAWTLLLMFVLFFPLQFWAPGGYIRVIQPTVQIVPNVAGQVSEVLVQANQQVYKGDVLYQIDTTPYQAAVNRLNAEHDVATIRFNQQQELMRKGVGRKADVDRTRSQMQSTQAQLDNAMYDLEQTTVRAPTDGHVTNVEALRPGARVVTAPLAQTMTVIDDSKRVVVAQIQQIYMRYIEPGQAAEIAFKMYPGQVYSAKVESIVPGSSLGQVGPTGQLASAVQENHGPMFVRLILDDKAFENTLLAGVTGNVAIYSSQGKPSHVIRKVIIRSTAITNYILPF